MICKYLEYRFISFSSTCRIIFNVSNKFKLFLTNKQHIIDSNPFKLKRRKYKILNINLFTKSFFNNIFDCFKYKIFTINELSKNYFNYVNGVAIDSSLLYYFEIMDGIEHEYESDYKHKQSKFIINICYGQINRFELVFQKTINELRKNELELFTYLTHGIIFSDKLKYLKKIYELEKYSYLYEYSIFDISCKYKSRRISKYVLDKEGLYNESYLFDIIIKYGSLKLLKILKQKYDMVEQLINRDMLLKIVLSNNIKYLKYMYNNGYVLPKINQFNDIYGSYEYLECLHKYNLITDDILMNNINFCLYSKFQISKRIQCFEYLLNCNYECLGSNYDSYMRAKYHLLDYIAEIKNIIIDNHKYIIIGGLVVLCTRYFNK